MSGHDQTDKRQPQFARNTRLEALLTELNEMLQPVNAATLSDCEDRHSKLFVHGPLRSGTTLFMQWLAASGLTAYPSNLLSRFYQAPHIGARIQMLLTDPRFRFRDELDDLSAAPGFQSDNGKTRGALAPNEFWYFWRRFLPFADLDYLPDEQLAEVADLGAMARELNALANLFDQPFAMKGMIMNQNIRSLVPLFSKPLFIWIKRDPVFNLQSVLEARQRQYGNMKDWYSFRIREYPQLKDLDPLHSAAGQICAINRAIENDLQDLPDAQKIIVPYEEFCRDTRPWFELIRSRITAPAETSGLPSPRNPSDSFSHHNQWRLLEYTQQQAEQAIAAAMTETLPAG